MLVGLDFDNTIVCYDRLFHQLAVERSLIPFTLPATKQAVRDHLRQRGLEDVWTELQGIAYGPRMVDAELFPGFREFLRCCKRSGREVVIVSHKTRWPFRGEAHDLHAAAHAFLRTSGLYDTARMGLSPNRVFLELTLADKLRRVGTLGCSLFIDDLPEVLAEPTFPDEVEKVLIDFADVHPPSTAYKRLTSWDECSDYLRTLEEVAS